MAEEPKDKIFTLPSQYVDDIIKECDEQTLVVDDLLKDLVNEEPFSFNKKAVMPYIAEIVWMNHSILNNISLEMNTAVFHYNETSAEDELVFTERSIIELQNYMLAR